jgi:endoglycosylceramidase
VTASGAYSPIVGSLSRTYPQAIAGTPTSVNFNPQTGTFHMTYVPKNRKAPTTIFIAQSVHYPRGWCAAVSEGRIVSAPGAAHLLVAPVGHSSRVAVTVTAGPCSPTG